MSKERSPFSVKMIASIGMFCAVAYVIMLLSKLIPVNVAGFLNLDFKDVIIAISGLLFGPVPAIIISVIVSLIEMITVSSTGPIGLLMNVISTCAFVLPAAFIYKARRKFGGALLGLITGVAAMTIVMLLWNWLITPLYMGVPRDVVVKMLVPTFLPFNLIKGGMNTALTLIIYKPIVSGLRRAGLVQASPSGSAVKKGTSPGVIIASAFIFISLVLVVLVWTNII